MRSFGPVDGLPPTPGESSPSLEYRTYLFTPGRVTANLVLAPSLPFMPGRGLRLAVSFGDEPPEIVEVLPAGYNAENGNRDWEHSVTNSSRTVRSSHWIGDAGYHTLKVWMIDPAVVVQKIVLETATARETSTCLGPPESFRGGGP